MQYSIFVFKNDTRQYFVFFIETINIKFHEIDLEQRNEIIAFFAVFCNYLNSQLKQKRPQLSPTK